MTRPPSKCTLAIKPPTQGVDEWISRQTPSIASTPLPSPPPFPHLRRVSDKGEKWRLWLGKSVPKLSRGKRFAFFLFRCIKRKESILPRVCSVIDHSRR